MQDWNVIEVNHVAKSFKIYTDKGHTLKERAISLKRNRYQTREVLKDINFQVKRGDSLGLIGHNGCGKSTLLKMLTKIMYPDKGSIEIRGRVSSLLELGAGFHPDLSGRENIYINASIFGMTRKEIDERLQTIIDFADLGDYIDNPVRTYSSGMYMRLAFSVAINVDADVLIVDEILAVGDVNFQRKCLKKMNELQEQGVTIVLVSHSMEQITSVCNQCVWIQDGVVVDAGETGRVTERYLAFMEEQAGAEHITETVRKKECIGTIDQAKLLANGAEGKCIFTPQDELELRFHYTGPSTGVVCFLVDITREDFVTCLIKDYTNDEKGYPGEEGFVTIKLGKLPLISGRYFMNLKVIIKDTDDWAAQVSPLCSFDMYAPGKHGGVLYVEPICEVRTPGDK